MQKVMGGEFRIEDELLQRTGSNLINVKYSSGRDALFTILNSEHAFGGGVLYSFPTISAIL